MKDNNAPEHSTGNFDCSLGGTTTAFCTESSGCDGAKFPGISTETPDPRDVLYVPVVITTGLVSNTLGTAVKTGIGAATCTAQTLDNALVILHFPLT